MNHHEYEQLINTASASTQRLNRGAGETAKLERDFSHAALGAVQDQAGNRGGFLVRVTSFRRRLLDFDNLCEKYHVDCCRYAGLIPDDAPGVTQIEVAQQKTGKDEAEQIVIEIFRLQDIEQQLRSEQ